MKIQLVNKDQDSFVPALLGNFNELFHLLRYGRAVLDELNVEGGNRLLNHGLLIFFIVGVKLSQVDALIFSHPMLYVTARAASGVIEKSIQISVGIGEGHRYGWREVAQVVGNRVPERLFEGLVRYFNGGKVDCEEFSWC